MRFKEWKYQCRECHTITTQMHWSTERPKPCACGAELYQEQAVTGRSAAVVDDQLEGGARFFEHMGPEPVYCATKTDWRREMKKRGIVCVG